MLNVGHFGKVYLARVKSASDPFILVLKCLSKDQVIDRSVQTQVRREIEVSCLGFRQRDEGWLMVDYAAAKVKLRGQ